jgi:hypothetical protein
MATDNDKKLTRYTSAVTIVTADTMNKLYGGEFGFNETVGEFDPLVYGHVHDGKHQDGHASKILLTSGAHVRGYLGNANLGGTNGTTPAVRYSNIFCYSEATFGSPAARRAAGLEILAIPEFVDNGVDRCYYLDLSNSAGGENGSIQFNESGAFGGNDDLVYNYSSLLLGLGTNTPVRKLHIVGDTVDPPVRVENIPSAPFPGAGTTIVIAPNGDLYADASIGGAGAFETTANVTSNSPGDLATDDFVFGSDSLDDDGDVNHDFRMLFDKSRGAFRAGEERATNWDEPSRGSYSFAFGTDVSANAWNSITFGQECGVSSLNSIVASGYQNAISYSAYIGPEDFTGQGYGNGILTGTGNGISADEFVPGGLNPGTAGNGTVGAAIVGGINNGIGRFGAASIIGSGEGNGISVAVFGKPTPPGEAFASGIFSGWQNIIANNGDSDVSVILGGKSNYIDGSYSIIGGGEQNLIEESALSGLGSHNAIVGGRLNLINSSGSRNFIGGGGGTLASNANEINDPASDSVVVGGANNTLNSSYSAIVCGLSNSIDDSNNSFIGSGETNLIQTTGSESQRNSIVGGSSNQITGLNAQSCFVGGGEGSTIQATKFSSIVGGALNNIQDSERSFIGGGSYNAITATGTLNFIGGGGDFFANVDANNITGTSTTSGIVVGSDNTINDSLDSAIAAGDGNTVNGAQRSFIAAGQNNEVTSADSSILSGKTCTVDGVASTILSGSGNTISSTSSGSAIINGSGNTTNAELNVAMGGSAVADNYGEITKASGQFADPGDAQAMELIWRNTTVDATPVRLYLDGSSEEWEIPQNSTFTFDIIITARKVGGTINQKSAGYRIFGVVDDYAGTTGIVGSNTFAAEEIEDDASWAAFVQTGIVPNRLRIVVSGDAESTVRWVAHGRIVKVGGAFTP